MSDHKINDNYTSKAINSEKWKDELQNPLSNLEENLKINKNVKNKNKKCLEDKMIKQENTRKILTLANLEKEKTRCLLRELKEELKQVLACNKLLPEPVQFSDDYFQLDERINNSIIEGEQSKMNKLRLKLAFNYEKSLLARNNVKNYFVDNILTNKFKVKAILYGVLYIIAIYTYILNKIFTGQILESQQYTTKQNIIIYLLV